MKPLIIAPPLAGNTLDSVEASAGSAVLVRRGTVHTYWNPGPGLLRYLLVMTSNIHSLVQEIHSTSDRSPAAMRARFEKHDSELIDGSSPGGRV